MKDASKEKEEKKKDKKNAKKKDEEIISRKRKISASVSDGDAGNSEDIINIVKNG